jgi:5-methylcytosine-specific restriction protein A
MSPRELVKRRAGDCCERCGAAISADHSYHHRRPRGMGGTKRKDTAANLVLVCGSGTTGCHGLIESQRTASFATGWLVRQHQDPASVPIDRHGAWVLLTEHGTLVVK